MRSLMITLKFASKRKHNTTLLTKHTVATKQIWDILIHYLVQQVTYTACYDLYSVRRVQENYNILI